ncbi:MAG: hypothetical protein WCJ39_08550, partial [bacterium]
TARSNYVLYPKKKVELKSHICPGFWATFLLHIIFWIVSPVLLASTLIWLGIDGPHWYLWIPAIPGLITPLWLFAATIKLLDILLNKITNKIKFPRTMQKIPIAIGIMIFVALGVVVIGFIIFAMGYMIVSMAPFFGNLLSALFILSILFYFVNGCIALGEIAGDNYSTWEIYRKIPTWIRRLASVSIIASAICIIDKISSKLIEWIVSIAVSIWSFISNYPYLFVWIIICAGFAWIVVWLMTLEQKNEKAFAKAERIIAYVVIGFFVLTLLFLGIEFIRNFRLMADSLKYVICGILGIMLIFTGYLLILRDKVNMTTIYTLEWADERYAHFMKAISGWSQQSKWSGTRDLFFYIDNKISAEIIDSLTDRVLSLAESLFYDDYEQRYWFVNRIIPVMTEELLVKLIKEEENMLCLENDWEKEFYITRIILGIAKPELVKQLEVVKQHKEKVKNRVEKITDIIIYPFVKSWEKVTQFFGTLKDIWQLLNKRCPTNATKRHLT